MKGFILLPLMLLPLTSCMTQTKVEYRQSSPRQQPSSYQTSTLIGNIPLDMGAKLSDFF